MDEGIVFYQNVCRGLSNPDGHRPVAYYGKVFRIPRSEHGTIRQLEWEITPADLLVPILPRSGPALHHVPDAVIERFEIYDQESGDIWVMYRIPYRAE